MSKNRKDLPVWAKIVFEGPESFSEFIMWLNKSITIWRKDVHIRSLNLELIEEMKK